MTQNYFLGPGDKDSLAQICPPPPWRYLSETLEVSFLQGIAHLRQILPQELEPTGRCFFSFVKMISVTGLAEWNDYFPERCQHNEMLYKIEVVYKGRKWNYCPFSLVDTDVALMRGWLMGFPKRLGRISLRCPPLGFGDIPPESAEIFESMIGKATTGSSPPVIARLFDLALQSDLEPGLPFLLDAKLGVLSPVGGSGTFVTPVVDVYRKANELAGNAHLIVERGGHLPSDFPDVELVEVKGGKYFQDFVVISGIKVAE